MPKLDDIEWDDEPIADVEYAINKVSGPAVALIIVTTIGLITIILCIAFDCFLLAGGLDHLNRNRIQEQRPQILVRVVWSVFILASNIVTIIGAYKMKQLQNPSLAYTACILSVIPFLGPCCIFGIPFGIWGLVAMSDPEVKRAFSNNDSDLSRSRP
jgi:hypothetical protein